MDKVRIDKWLWAARFFKTRSLAKEAIEAGRVRLSGDRLKPSKEITVGVCLNVRIGFDTRDVDVIALSDKRRGASEAQLLYRETDESVERRESQARDRRLMNQADSLPPKRPTKKQRRQIHRFRDDNFYE